MGNIKLVVVHLWKCTIFSIVTFYRTIRDYPLASLMAVLSYLLYTYLPSVFGFLLYCSPIVVCTLVLLGALLNFGYPQTTEFEQKRVRINSKDDHLHTHVRKINGKREKEVGFLPIPNKDKLIDRTVVIEEKPKQIHAQKPPIKVDKKLQNLGFFMGSETRMANRRKEPVSNSGWELGNQPTKVFKKMKKMKGLKVKIQKPVCGLPINHLKEWVRDPSCINVSEDNSEYSDFGSDRAQCSSPLDSIADVIPVLDELHPLLDIKQPQYSLPMIEESEPPSDWSGRSNDGSIVSELEESEEEGNQEEVEDEEAFGSEDETVKNVVTWTEDDEKNLKDLGTSELERNQRLENLVEKRRAFKTLSMEKERNLIDLGSSNPSTKVAPILTTRTHNPFDSPFFSNESGEVQVVPSSAPSVLVPRRNPFDLAFEPIEERSNLNGEQDVTPIHLDKDMSFCRHQSFTLGTTGAKDKREFNLISFLENEKTESEGNGHPRLERQLSEKSESRLSCVLETETVYTTSDEEDEEKLDEQELSPKSKLVSQIGHSFDHEEQVSQSSEEEEEEEEEEDSGDIDREDQKDNNLNKVEVHRRDGETTWPDVELESKPTAPSISTLEANENTIHENAEEFHLKNQEPRRNDSIEGRSNLVKPSLSEINVESKSIDKEHPDDKQIEAPVYDLSPSAMESRTIDALISGGKEETLTSTSSKASDLQEVDNSHCGSVLPQVEETHGLKDENPKSSNESVINDMTGTGDGMEESRLSVSTSEDSDYTTTEDDFAEANDNHGDPVSASPAQKSVADQIHIDSDAALIQDDSIPSTPIPNSMSRQVPIDSSPNSSSVTNSDEDGLFIEVHLPSSEPEIHVNKLDFEMVQDVSSSPLFPSQKEKTMDKQLTYNVDHEEPESLYELKWWYN